MHAVQRRKREALRAGSVRWVAAVVILTGGLGGCEPLSLDPVSDPNNPTVGAVLTNATRGQLQNLVYGLEARQRGTFTATASVFGAFGRELWYIQTDGRSVTDLLGQNGLTPYPDHWGTGGTYGTPYGAIRQANLLVEAVRNTGAVTAAEAAGYEGFARTIAGLQYLTPLNAQYRNGIRIDVGEVLAPGPFLGYEAALAEIRGILDDAHALLGQAGTDFAFELTSGFSGFESPAGIREFNRAIAARAALYAEDWQGVLTALDGSFLDLEGDLQAGPRAVYGGPPDVFNPLFFPVGVNAAPLIAVHPAVIEDAVEGDARVSAKFAARDNPLAHTLLNVNVTHQPILWPTPASPVAIIRNEELVLMYAEAQAHLGRVADAVEAIDVVRAASGLPAYDGPVDLAALVDEILFQRRYSLWGEGHRWIDLRRYDRLDEIPLQYDGGTVFVQLERPVSETSWEESR